MRTVDVRRGRDSRVLLKVVGVAPDSRGRMSAAQVTIPANFEAHLALGDGSAGADVSEVLGLSSSQVVNLYSCGPDQFTYSFQVLWCFGCVWR